MRTPANGASLRRGQAGVGRDVEQRRLAVGASLLVALDPCPVPFGLFAFCDDLPGFSHSTRSRRAAASAASVCSMLARSAASWTATR